MIRELKDKIKINYMSLIFNLINIDTIDSNTNFQLPASKEADIQGGYGDITHFTTKDGNKNQAYYEKNSNDSMNVAFTNTDENLLLSTLFCPTSLLQRENLYSLSLLSSHKILSSSLELEKNKILNNRFYERIEQRVA